MYFSSDAGVPESVAALLTKNKNSAADVCVSRDGRVTYYAPLSPVQLGHFGVCKFRLGPSLIKTETSPNLPQTIYMLTGEANCPRQDSQSYVQTSGVSEGGFVTLDAFFRKMLLSSKNFKSAFRIDQNALGARKVDFEQLEADVSKKDNLYKLRGILLSELLLSVDVYGYELSIWSNTAARGWVLTVDLTPQGFKIFNFARLGDN